MSTEASTGAGGSSAASSAGASSAAGSTEVTFVVWPEGWRSGLLVGSTDSEREAKQLERYESPEQIWRKARELERRLSAGELKSALPKGASPEEIARWRAENGVPAKPEDYQITVPAGREIPKDDDAFLRAFLKSAHAANYTQAHVDTALAAFYAEVDRQEQALAEAESAAERDADEKLRAEWGGDYRTNKAMAESLLSRAPAGFRDRFLNGFLSDHTPIRASIEAWKWLVQMEREINPAATVVPAGSGDLGKTITDELANYKQMMGNPNSEYWKGPKAEGHQARYRELLEADQKLKARAAA